MLQEFSIEKSKDIHITPLRGGMSKIHYFNDNPETLKIVSVEMKNNKKIIIQVLKTNGNKQECTITSKNDAGLEKINIIFSQRDDFIEKSYQELITHIF